MMRMCVKCRIYMAGMRSLFVVRAGRQAESKKCFYAQF